MSSRFGARPRKIRPFYRGRGPYSRILYHGTKSEFDEFVPQGKGWVTWTFGEPEQVPRTGFFFTTNPEFARNFAGPEGRVIKAKVKLGDLPYPLLYVPWGEVKEEYPDWQANPIPNQDVSDKLDAMMRERGVWNYQPWMLFDEDAGPKTISILEEAGYKSASFFEWDEQDVGGETFVVWDPSRVEILDQNWHPRK